MVPAWHAVRDSSRKESSSCSLLTLMKSFSCSTMSAKSTRPSLFTSSWRNSSSSILPSWFVSSSENSCSTVLALKFSARRAAQRGSAGRSTGAVRGAERRVERGAERGTRGGARAAHLLLCGPAKQVAARAGSRQRRPQRDATAGERGETHRHRTPRRTRRRGSCRP